MSFREKLVVSEEKPMVEEAPKAPVVRETKQCFADGICNVCGRALFDHDETKGVKYDCNGWPLAFLDEKQETVREREQKAKEAEAATRV